MKQLISIITLFVGTYLHAQEPSNKPLKTNKQWEIGADIRWVWKDYNESMLFFRKNFSKGDKKIAHRYGFSVSKSHYDSSRTLSSTLILGKEWQYSKNKLTIFYGADIPLSWSHTYDTDASIETTNVINTGITPFIGGRYPIIKGMAISWTTGFSLKYQYHSHKEQPTHSLYSLTSANYQLLLTFNI